MTDVCYHNFPPPRVGRERRCRECGATAADVTRDAMSKAPAVNRHKRPSVDAVPLEKDEQARIKEILEAIGAKFYEIGRPRAQRCWKCHEITKDQGTRQTPGIPDLFVFLPLKKNRGPFRSPEFVWIEAKRVRGSRTSPEQIEFRDSCLARSMPHVVGHFDIVVDWLARHHFVEAA